MHRTDAIDQKANCSNSNSTTLSTTTSLRAPDLKRPTIVIMKANFGSVLTLFLLIASSSAAPAPSTGLQAFQAGVLARQHGFTYATTNEQKVKRGNEDDDYDPAEQGQDIDYTPSPEDGKTTEQELEDLDFGDTEINDAEPEQKPEEKTENQENKGNDQGNGQGND